MKAMILAAGLGTRLRPWTEKHPKALVPVGGVPMLERVIESLRNRGFNEIVVNAHHFADQIIDFLASKSFGDVHILVSDERRCLLDTGGGIVNALPLLCADERPFLVHNVDILTDADLVGLMARHDSDGAAATLLVSTRKSSRRLVVSPSGYLEGWHNLATDLYRPEGFLPNEEMKELAFSGIYVLSPSAVLEMKSLFGDAPFPVMDYFMSRERKLSVACVEHDFRLIDIGKPETLHEANKLVESFVKI